MLMAPSPHPVRRPRRRASQLSLLALLCAALPGCQSIDMSSAQLRVIDASPDAGPIDSYQNNEALAYNLEFGNVTSYAPMSPGTYTLAADRAGTRQTLASVNRTLLAGKQYTEIVGNSVASLQPTLLLDKSTPAPAGEIQFRFVQQLIHTGAVDVYLVPKNGGRLAASSPLITNLGFGANSGYLTVPAGSYAVEVVPAGTTLVPATVTLLSGAQNDYASGAVRTVVLIDQEIVGPHPAGLTPGVQAIVAADCDGVQ
jgi:hypothetical protein